MKSNPTSRRCNSSRAQIRPSELITLHFSQLDNVAFPPLDYVVCNGSVVLIRQHLTKTK